MIVFQRFTGKGIQYTVVTRIETRVNKTPGETFVSSVQFSCSVVSDSLQPHGLQHARFPCPSPSPRAYSNSCPSSQWCHPTISSSVVPFSISVCCVLSHFSHARLCMLWTVAHQALLPMGFSRQEYLSGLPFPSPGDLPDLRIEPHVSYVFYNGRQVLYH